jgi:hypothetical protein
MPDSHIWTPADEFGFDLNMLQSSMHTMGADTDSSIATTPDRFIASLKSHSSSSSGGSSSLEQMYRLTLELTCGASRVEQIISTALANSETFSFRKDRAEMSQSPT